MASDASDPRPDPRPDPEWICLDCTDECETRSHAWVRARRLEREDGTEAWEVDLTDLNADAAV